MIHLTLVEEEVMLKVILLSWDLLQLFLGAFYLQFLIMQIFKKFSQLSIFYSEYVSFLYPHATTVKKADKCTINHSLLHSHSVSSHASHKFVSSGGKTAGGEGDGAGAEMVGPQRPQFVLFGSSIVQLSYANGGWGAILSDVYARKVLPLALFFHILNASF